MHYRPLSRNGITYGRIRFLIGAPQEDQTLRTKLARNRGRGVENLHRRGRPRRINFETRSCKERRNRRRIENRDTSRRWMRRWKNRTWLISRVSTTNHYVTRKYPSCHASLNIFFHWHFFMTQWYISRDEMSHCALQASIFSNREPFRIILYDSIFVASISRHKINNSFRARKQ